MTSSNSHLFPFAIQKHMYNTITQELTANLTLQWEWGGSRRTIDDEYSFQGMLYSQSNAKFSDVHKNMNSNDMFTSGM